MENANLETSDTKHEADVHQENATTTQLTKLKSPAPAEGTEKATRCKKHATKAHKSKSRSKSKKKKDSRKTEQSSTSESSESFSSSSSSEESDDDDDADTESESSDSEARRKKRRKARAKARKEKDAKKKKKSGSRKPAVESSTDDSSDDDDDDESSADEGVGKKSARAKVKAKAKAKARKAAQQKAEEEAEQDEVTQEDPNEARLKAVEAQLALLTQITGETGTPAAKRRARRALRAGLGGVASHDTEVDDALARKKGRGSKGKKNKRASKIAFKRVDQLWDSSIHNYKLTETIDDSGADEWDQYIFTVRRQFDWEHKYEATFVDIRSKPLKDSLQHVMEDVKGISLVQDTPSLDPNMLFLFLEEIRTYMGELKVAAKKEKKKARKAAAMRASHLKVLVKYLDKDFAETKKTLYPLLENDMITFDLLWALFKPNTVVYTPTYNDSEQPRCFKMEYATRESSFTKGTWYSVDGRYLEYDGKAFGMGTMYAEVSSFKGSRKISSLSCYPIKYHKNVEEFKAKLIERGKKFVALKGMNYRVHEGRVHLSPIIFGRKLT